MSPQQTKGSEKSNISSFEFAREAEGFSSTPRPMGRAQHYCSEPFYRIWILDLAVSQLLYYQEMAEVP
jgi:hypothetical protein